MLNFNISKVVYWELSDEPIILCGDWNVVLYYHNDTINDHDLKENNPNAQKSVLELIDTFELDVIFQKRVRVFHRVSNTRKLMKARGRRPSAFIVFECLKPR